MCTVKTDLQHSCGCHHDELIYLCLAGLLQLLLRLGQLLARLRQLALRIRQLLLCLRSPSLQVQRHLQRHSVSVVH